MSYSLRCVIFGFDVILCITQLAKAT